MNKLDTGGYSIAVFMTEIKMVWITSISNVDLLNKLLEGIVVSAEITKKNEPFTISATDTSNIVQRKRELPSQIVNASMDNVVRMKQEEFFRVWIERNIRPSERNGLRNDLCKLISEDDSIDENDKAELLKMAEQEPFSKFLSEAFLLAVRSRNKCIPIAKEKDKKGCKEDPEKCEDDQFTAATIHDGNRSEAETAEEKLQGRERIERYLETYHRYAEDYCNYFAYMVFVVLVIVLLSELLSRIPVIISIPTITVIGLVAMLIFTIMCRRMGCVKQHYADELTLDKASIDTEEQEYLERIHSLSKEEYSVVVLSGIITIVLTALFYFWSLGQPDGPISTIGVFAFLGMFAIIVKVCFPQILYYREIRTLLLG